MVKESNLPAPEPAARAHSDRVMAHLRELIADSGPLRFDRYWEEVLYRPDLGYYAAGPAKFGAQGDFVTAPELGSVFGRCVATQMAQVLGTLGGGDVLELGAGTGAFAAAALERLRELDALPSRYLILERSAELAERQRKSLAARLGPLADRVEWLDRLPDAVTGVVFANEVLDALAPRRVVWQSGGWQELHVTVRDGALGWIEQPVDDQGNRLAAIEACWFEPPVEPYVTELQPTLEGWVATLAERLDRGLMLLVDYGYRRPEYYHPQRAAGTLICHYRHRAHDDPFRWPGLTDLSVSVDFTAVAEAADAGGARPMGYTSQALFLMASGLEAEMGAAMGLPETRRIGRLSEIKRLTLPAEMGERFKVLAAGRGLDESVALAGFAHGDRLFEL